MEAAIFKKAIFERIKIFENQLFILFFSIWMISDFLGEILIRCCWKFHTLKFHHPTPDIR